MVTGIFNFFRSYISHRHSKFAIFSVPISVTGTQNFALLSLYRILKVANCPIFCTALLIPHIKQKEFLDFNVNPSQGQSFRLNGVDQW